MIQQESNAGTRGPLSPEDYQQLALAKERSKKIRRAAGVATFNGWTTGVLAVLSAPFIFFGWPSILITACLAVVAWNELRGRKRLLNFDVEAPVLLGWNQLGFLAAIVGYCCWRIYTGPEGLAELEATVQSNPELNQAFDQSLGSFQELARLLTYLVYGLVIFLSLIYQGWNALYYFSRRRIVVAYVRETPDWVLELQRNIAAS